MEWQWNANGKRVKVGTYEDTKKKRIGNAEVYMEDDTFSTRLFKQRLQMRIDREMCLYRQQVNDIYYQCCRK